MPSAEHPELLKVLVFVPGVGQNIDLPAAGIRLSQWSLALRLAKCWGCNECLNNLRLLTSHSLQSISWWPQGRMLGYWTRERQFLMYNNSTAWAGTCSDYTLCLLVCQWWGQGVIVVICRLLEEIKSNGAVTSNQGILFTMWPPFVPAVWRIPDQMWLCNRPYRLVWKETWSRNVPWWFTLTCFNSVRCWCLRRAAVFPHIQQLILWWNRTVLCYHCFLLLLLFSAKYCNSCCARGRRVKWQLVMSGVSCLYFVHSYPADILPTFNSEDTDAYYLK